jgi:glycerophosphoryl diester phosphodiesterase
MPVFEIVGHRGAPDQAPENTIPAFEQAIKLGADAVEFDVRLTADKVPTVFHFTYLEEITTSQGLIAKHTYDQIKELTFVDQERQPIGVFHVPTLEDVIAAVGGRTGLEIELKGPEPEAPVLVAQILNRYRHLWERIEVTSYEPAILLAIHEHCPGLATDLLYPRSQPWMKLDVIAYEAAQRARLAKARRVHLHPSQLTPVVVDQITAEGIIIHAWQVEDIETARQVIDLGITRFSTESIALLVEFRQSLSIG